MTGPGVYCLGRLPEKNWSPDPDERDLQQRRQELYLELIDTSGTCGLVAVPETAQPQPISESREMMAIREAATRGTVQGPVPVTEYGGSPMELEG